MPKTPVKQIEVYIPREQGKLGVRRNKKIISLLEIVPISYSLRNNYTPLPSHVQALLNRKPVLMTGQKIMLSTSIKELVMIATLLLEGT